MITATAFRVSPDLLGIPLAPHWKRIAAILVDLALIAVLANLVGGVILGVLAAAFFLRMALRPRRDRDGNLLPAPRGATAAFSTTLRGTAGCLGGFILFVTLVVFAFTGPWSSGSPPPPSPATSAASARAPAGETSAFLRELRTELDEDASAEEIEAYVMRELGSFLGTLGRPGAAPAGPAPTPVPEGAADADPLPDDEPEPDSEAFAGPAGDSLRALAAALERERRLRETADTRNRQMRSEMASLRERAEAGPGIRARLRGLAEDLGLGIGWGALYFSVFMTLWKGQTPGKRLFRLRVVRLDQSRITWWTALERYGGYAAGFATGLLGFLQVYWDPNRQATHDKIAGTVVVQGGRAPLAGFGNPGNP